MRCWLLSVLTLLASAAAVLPATVPSPAPTTEVAGRYYVRQRTNQFFHRSTVTFQWKG